MVFQGSFNLILQQAAIQEFTDIRKRMHSVVALVGWILASQCRSKDTGPQHHKEVPIHAGARTVFIQLVNSITIVIISYLSLVSLIEATYALWFSVPAA